MKSSIALLCSTLFVFTLFAQKDPIKWGKVPEEDLKMKMINIAPDAEAMVLADFGKLTFDLRHDELKYELKRHVRVKIFSKSGFDRANISIPLYTYGSSERLLELKAQVILPNGDIIKLSKSEIFEEKINKYWTAKKFALPNIEEGCVFEYYYRKRSDQIYFIDDWYFQTDIPTRLSEFRTEIPKWYNYVSFSQGMPYQVESSSQTKTVPFKYGNSSVGNRVEVEMIKKRYFLENIPGLKKEAFITTMRDYYSKISLQLKSIDYPRSPVRDVSANWTTIAKNLMETQSFGGQIKSKKFTKKLMAELGDKLDGKTELEQALIIYHYLSNTVQWNDRYSVTSKSITKAFEEKSATTGELNLMFIAACKQAGLSVYPILISTRSHGRPMRYYPKIDQFNHVISLLQVDNENWFFDVGSPTRSPGLLRLNSLNHIGWLVDEANPQWVNLPQPKDTEITFATMALNPDGNLSGSIAQSLSGYCGMDARNEYYDNIDDDFNHIRTFWQDAFPDAKIDSISFENIKHVADPLKSTVTVNIPQVAQVNDDFIYFSPMLAFGQEENLLKSKTRTFPVDLPIPKKEQYIMNLTIPEGYEVEELPEPISLKMDGNAGKFQYIVSNNGNTLQVVSKVIIDKTHFEPEEYNIIKGFLDLIVEKHGEQIVLKKKS